MRIGLLGTRGIPNRYGGFEEFAEQVVYYWARQGHTVFVFCDVDLAKVPYDIPNVVRVFQRTNYLILGQVFYDWNCTRRALSLNCDIVYHAGYVTSVLGNFVLYSRLKGKLIYNLDGLEWRRSKFNFLTRIGIQSLEFLVVRSGATLVSDNRGIQDHFKQVHRVETKLIEYGVKKYTINCEQESNSNNALPAIFDLVISRFEPENHILEIINTYEILEQFLVVVCNVNSRFYLKNRIQLNDLKFVKILGPIYDKDDLYYLRNNCRFYVHGHSVGGTNPSLLEAMIIGCKILAHDNCFNFDVLGDFGFYWTNESALFELLVGSSLVWKVDGQIDYTLSRFNWEEIATKHLELFEKEKLFAS